MAQRRDRQYDPSLSTELGQRAWTYIAVEQMTWREPMWWLTSATFADAARAA